MKNRKKSFTINNVMIGLRGKGKVRWFDCDCGKKFSVTTNLYDRSDSGRGGCECGKSQAWIN